MNLRFIQLLLLILWTPILSTGQIDRIYESEIQKEAKFIDALQLRILEKWEEAREAFLILEKSDPTNDVVSFELAKIYYVLKDDQHAVIYAKKAVVSNGEKKIYKEFLLDLYASMKDYTSLNEQLNQFIDSESFEVDYFYQLAKSYSEERMYKEAIKVLNKLEDKTSYSEKLGKAKLSIYQRERNSKKVLRELDKLVKHYPNKIDLLLHKAILLNAMQKADKALEVYKEILLIDPNHVAANLYVSSYSSEANTEAGFLSSLETIIRNDKIPLDDKIKQLIPYVPGLTKNKSLIEPMLNSMDILQSMYPENAKVNALHGDIFFDMGDFDKAMFFYQKTLRLNRRVFMVWKQLMMAQDFTESYEDLSVTAELAIEYYPNQAVCYYYKAKALFYSKDYKGAFDWLDEGFMLSGNNVKLRSEFYLLMAAANLKLGKEIDAINLFEKIDGQALGSHHSFLLEVRGDLFLLQKRPEKAIIEWEKAIRAGGKSKELQKKINRNKN